MEKLKPCPFCGAIPTIRWEKWREISETSGCYVLDAPHEMGCFIRSMDGMNTLGQAHSFYKDGLVARWNTRMKGTDDEV